MISKLLKTLTIAAVLTLLAAGTANAQMATGAHDLRTNAGSLPVGWDGGTDLCRFCHTPHNARAVAPLWDRSDPDTAGTFTLYTSATMDDTMPQPSGVSEGCLSCHDGVTAFDAIAGGTGAAVGNTMNADYTGSPAILGTSLSNDHPIGVDVTVDANMELPAAIILAGVPLFTDGVSDVLVECASCHNAHESSFTYFLRKDPVAGDLCESCHTQ